MPIGPVGVITPWNTPFMLSTWKIAPALAAGCTVVHKPAELLAADGARCWSRSPRRRACRRACWNLVNGLGEDAGKALTEHPAIKAIGFVGESRTGSLIMKQGADTLKRVHFELGGKNPVIVFADADLDRARRRRRLHDLFAERRALHLVVAPAGRSDSIYDELHRSGWPRRPSASGSAIRSTRRP